eukprot:4158858-Prymnesium_polylepis.1
MHTPEERGTRGHTHRYHVKRDPERVSHQTVRAPARTPLHSVGCCRSPNMAGRHSPRPECPLPGAPLARPPRPS